MDDAGRGNVTKRMQFADANSAAGHLLRHLHDAVALRHNPLVAHIFAQQELELEPRSVALARVHDLVTSAAQRIFGGESGMVRGLIHKQRQLEIITRCDVGGELHKNVQQDMGLGARQFYRERLRARSQLAKALEALVPAKLSESDAALDPRGLAIARIRAAKMRADDELAVALIRRELDVAPEPPERLELYAMLAELLSEAGEFSQARKTLDAARELGLDDAYALGRLLQVEAELASVEGRYLAAARCCDAAIGHYRRLPLPRALEHDEQLATTLLLTSLTKHWLGQHEDSLAALHATREIVERRPQLPLLLKVKLLEDLGAAQMLLPGSRTIVESHLLEALALAQRNGLVREAVSCTLYVSYLHELKGDPERALTIGREALTIAQKVYGRAVYAWYCLTFAGRELAHGFHDNAIRLAHTARACNDAEVCVALANVIEAEASLRLEDSERAYVLALSAIETFRRDDYTPFLGNALRIASEAAYGLGRIEYARYAIKESLSLLERYGNSMTMNNALRASKTINSIKAG